MDNEKATQIATNPTSCSSQSDNENFFIQATGGFDKKGRVFGLGASASRVKASKRSSSHIGGVSASKHKLKQQLTVTTQKLEAMTQLVNQQAEALNEQTEMLNEQAEMLNQQSEMLNEQAEMLNQRAEMLNQQAEVKKQMQEQAEMMKQMQEQLQFLLKDKQENKKDKGSAPGDDDEHDYAATR